MAQTFKSKTLLGRTGIFSSEINAPNLVYHTGDQNISGSKIFLENLTVSGTGFFENINISNLGELVISGAKVSINGNSGVYINTSLYVSGNSVLTGIDLSSFGTSANIEATGSNLHSYINSLSGDAVLRFGAQNISGNKTFIDSVIVSGTGIFNAIDLNNIDNLALSGIDISITGSTVNVYGNILISGNPVLTGVDLSLYATISNLALTGSVLQDRISNLSGVFNTTGASLQDRLTNLSGAFNITGANLQDRLTSLSGAFNTTGASLQDRITNLSGAFNLTGANLQNRLTSLSGAFNTTGANLHDRLTTLSGQVVFLNNAQTITGSKIFIGTTTFSGQEVNLIDTALNLSGVGDMTFSSTNINFINSPVFISGTDFRVSGNIYGYNMFVSGNPVLTGIPDGSWATQNELEGLSGAFNLTGANLQDRLTSFSGIALIRDRNQTHSGNLTVTGHFSAASKSFLIDHPTQIGKKLQYGSLESPYHGIRLTDKNKLSTDSVKVNLPDYISSLVDNEKVNIQLTNINHDKVLFVKDININENNFIVGMNRSWFDKNEYEFYWSFTAERKDIPKLTVEF